MKQCDVGSEM